MAANGSQALNQGLIHARDAQINAETAEQAARRAQISFETTQETLEQLQNLAVEYGNVGAIWD